MPTTNPRLNVTLSRESKKRLARLRALTGQPESRWVAMFVDGAIPVMDALIQSLAVVKSKPHEAARIMAELMGSAVAQAKQEQRELTLLLRKRNP